jgi:cell division protein FtsW (lipid II flippase)
MAEKTKAKSARNFVILMIIFAIISIVSIYSASFTVGERLFKNGNYFFIRQIIWYSIGTFLMVVFSRIDYRIYKNYINYIYGAGFFLLLMVEFFGSKTKGAVRWIIRISLIPVRILKAGCIPSCAMHLSIIAGQRKYEGIYMYYQNLNIISC